MAGILVLAAEGFMFSRFLHVGADTWSVRGLPARLELTCVAVVIIVFILIP